MSLQDIGRSIRNFWRTLGKGEILLVIGKYYMHILYLFVLAWISIMLSLKVDKTLTRAGANKAAIEELRIRHTESEAALVKIKSASATETRLKKLGSDVQMPSEPATVVKTK